MADDKKEGEGSVEQSELENKTIEERLKLLEEENKKLKEKEGIRRSINDMSEAELEHNKEMHTLLRDTAELIGDRVERNKQALDLARLEAEERLKGLTDNVEKQQEYLAALDEMVKYGNKELLALGDIDEKTKEILKTVEEEASIKRGMALIDDNAKVVADKLAASVGLRLKYKDSLFAKSAKMLKVLQDEGQAGEDARKAMVEYLKQTFSLNNIALNIFDTIKKNSISLFNNFDKAQASLAAATGQGDAFRSTLYEVGRQGNLFGISMDDAAQAIGTLVDQTSNFTSMSKATKEEVALNVAKMEKLGVAAADSAQIFQNFNQALGMTAEESINMQTELAMAGVGIGISASKITKDFNASLSTLMVYGRESIDVFKGIAAAAKAAGVETSTLLNIAGKFDTFSGAAEGAGKLNALLGTQLSTTEMLMATEDERIRMLVESVQSQGVAFQDMDKFTQMAIANAAGISDMAEANRIFGMSLQAFDENEKQLNASAAAQEKLDEAVSKTVKVMDQFKLLGAEIVVALEPFMETLEKGAKALTDVFKEMDTETKEMIGTIGALVSGFILLIPIIKVGGALLLPLKLLGTALLPSIATTAPLAGGGLATMGASIAPVLPILLKFGLIVMGVVASLALLAGAVALIGEAFSSSTFDMQIAESEAKMAEMQAQVADAEARASEFQFKSAKAVADIVTGDHAGALASVTSMVEEINKMGQDVKVSSTIENLALITAGKASSMTGERVSASQTSVTANVQNFFQGMEMTLNVDGEQMKGYVSKVANGEI